MSIIDDAIRIEKEKDKLAFMAAMILPGFVQSYPSMNVTERAHHAVDQARAIISVVEKIDK